MDLNVKTAAGAQTIQVSDDVFGAEYKQSLIHQVVTAYMSAARSGTKAQKNRAAVQGGGAKPFRQKGTGRARAGTSRSPIWRSGGVNFAATPRNYEQKINRKMYRGAIRSILSELNRQERLVVVDEISISQPKTKELVGKLKDMELKDVLVVSENPDENLYLASRNLYGVDVRDVEEIDPVSLVAYEHVLVTESAVKKLEERLA
ncbi:MAG: 50S ribosomal protein L4 [Candidatus Thiodiazotropha lotti]|uniref:Large ribosomal subunit protein uL4 n=1 Tax=Candidatus Thiodiazotropha endoloripes TaxID=1818881 RepID=A0A1E2ULI0_9GAMM|nr:50S ribosomal protein L4 [Candidatus Thiodiazotropha endoloripes]MCG7898876.1 50S ribosomal protein L4 [Candidatus Thiodiazotropha weberae]MCG7930971.1 50S ribosomal protein L4 [Candidatus Thiodiazotropha lotti]MCG7902003.1 50S ribosomal protein L4 [Candidatus Thiodiazotropha weberae]MCG7914924.1 50S ribosomal protein L4 [Candidatus Thiodiazotropha weberae]MCG7991965.1 50S ribosomal protein L4 [Candidatus Thiodiazotropha lotti]